MSGSGTGRGRGPGGRRFGRGRGRGRGGRTFNGEVPLCTFFVQGRCRHGDDCRFRHDKSALTASLPSGRPASTDGNTGGPANLSIGNARRGFDPFKAEAIARAKAAQDAEERPWSAIAGPFYSIDVECVATGYGDDRSQRIPGRVAMVDGEGNTVIDEIVKHGQQQKQIVSYLTALTGLTQEKCEDPKNKEFAEISDLVRLTLPKVAVLVGQSIDHDIEWLGLRVGQDFRESIDLTSIFCQRIPQNLGSASNAVRLERKLEENGATSYDARRKMESTIYEIGFPTRYRIFSLRHACVHCLSVDMQSAHHDPADDARYSILLFNKYQKAPIPLLRAMRDSLHRAPVTPSFSAANPVVDGVCMSKAGYLHKRAARSIWKWWVAIKGDALTRSND